MSGPSLQPGDRVAVGRDMLQRLFDALRGAGYRLVGPTFRDRAVVLEEIASAGDLPAGWGDEQDGGVYRLRQRGDGALFGGAAGPQSWKKFLHVPARRLWRARRGPSGITVEEEGGDAPRFAFIGVRACDLHAIAIQDRVFLQGTYADPAYRARREQAFLVAVNCGQAGGTCFCVSMGTGPKATSGFDLALTEIADGAHRFVVEVGTARGAEVMREVPHRPAQAEDLAEADAVVARAAGQMGRAMEASGLRDLLVTNPEHPRWEQVAARCLTCGNCTMVCPTCFCTTVEEVSDLGGESAERWQRWDSCFTMDFSYLHGGSVRASARSRYRQWMTHKLATWIDQFGTSGCVGCGRCITWCPVGIDITEEVRAIRGGAPGGAGDGEVKDDAHA
ncbi:MAG: 4Fe-4S dicluster domain-containing protein [Armatimonadetes bacterium]|nr:4Fe-4S dicluster domain-containing protein [Armatimonadota bacterium]